MAKDNEGSISREEREIMDKIMKNLYGVTRSSGGGGSTENMIDGSSPSSGRSAGERMRDNSDAARASRDARAMENYRDVDGVDADTFRDIDFSGESAGGEGGEGDGDGDGDGDGGDGGK